MQRHISTRSKADGIGAFSALVCVISVFCVSACGLRDDALHVGQHGPETGAGCSFLWRCHHSAFCLRDESSAVWTFVCVLDSSLLVGSACYTMDLGIPMDMEELPVGEKKSLVASRTGGGYEGRRRQRRWPASSGLGSASLGRRAEGAAPGGGVERRRQPRWTASAERAATSEDGVKRRRWQRRPTASRKK